MNIQESYSYQNEHPTEGVSEGNAPDTADSDTRRQIRTGSSWYASVFLVVNAALGAGLLDFPVAYDQCGGIVVALLVQAVFMVFIIGAFYILAYCSDLNQHDTYQDVMHAMCGKLGLQFCSVMITLYAYGTCITFFIIIADQLDKFFKYAYGPTFGMFWYMSRTFTVPVSCILLVLPLCFSKRIDFLKYVSFVGVLAIIYVVLLVSIKYFTIHHTEPVVVRTEPRHWTDVFMVVPVICFGYQCHISVIPIYSCMTQRNLRQFTLTISVSLLILVLTYSVTASLGYLTFGTGVSKDILQSYDPTPDVLIAMFLVAAKMYTTYPILLYVGRVALDSVWTALSRQSAESLARGERRRRYVVTTLWFVSTLAIAVFLPNIDVVIKILGGLAAIFVFTLPGLCLLQLLLCGYVQVSQRPGRYYTLSVMAVMYLILGAFIFGVTVTQSVMRDANLLPQNT